MKTANEYCLLLRDYKHKHAAEYGIERMGIFGSVARGDQTEDSDVDIYIEAPQMSLFGLASLHIALEKHLKTPVDITCKHDNMNAYFKQRIEKELIYV
ncbi:MAG: nucleotidyltransferase domain-containing protein [Prevotellaceae bacterium]|jgi:predicted nucleotidyltransferase|nr:nucleotidyltransferase domain-containing protein [Prevotellaceae bacterium]